jgi:hypothetical protein
VVDLVVKPAIERGDEEWFLGGTLLNSSDPLLERERESGIAVQDLRSGVIIRSSSG